MGLPPGTRIGPYDVITTLGLGGMGEVYRARDPKLARDVALKVLPEAFASDPARLARFEREAKVLATLNHAHIAQIYGAIEEHPAAGPPIHALAMELVEGHDLAEIIARGALPIDAALDVAHQIADALEAAHQSGVIHRDLKPANVKRRPDGTVKVLDFGLAKAIEQAGASGESGRHDVANSPTMTSPAMTAVGIILGTAAYMSPEQARGRAVDKRADIWAFGCLLYEMLTGRRAFEGDDVADVMGAVIHKEPAFDRLPPGTPGSVRATIATCLQKDPRKRFHDIGDVRLALEGAFSAAALSTAPLRPRPVAAILVAGVLFGAVVAGTAAWMIRRPPVATRQVLRFQIPVPEAARFGSFFSLSPNGRMVAFQARDATTGFALWVHSFDTGLSHRLDRSGGMTGSPFWSRDGRFIGYSSGTAIHQIDVAGSPPEELSRLQRYAGGAWAADGTLVLGRVEGGLLKIARAGEESVPLTELDSARKEIGHTNPSFLPDGRHFVYLRVSSDPALTGIFVGSVDASPSAQPLERIVAATEQAGFAPGDGGLLVYVRGGALMGQSFDLSSFTLTGTPVEIASRVGIGPPGYAHFTVSGNGEIAFRGPDESPGGIPTWFDRNGRALGTVADTLNARALYPRLSPDGKRLALILGESLWVYDLTGRPPIRLLTGTLYSPLWTNDGQELVFERTGSVGLHALPADGSTATSRLVTPRGHFHAAGFSADGTDLLATVPDEGQVTESAWNIVRIPYRSPASAVPVVATPASEGFSGVALSPGGQWLAYVADTTGSLELWVRPYPGPGAPVRVSPNGAIEPVWSRNGRELFYLERGRLMVAAVETSAGAIAFRAPVPLFETTTMVVAPQPPSYDVAPDGRLLLLRAVPVSSSPIEVVLNWLPTR